MEKRITRLEKRVGRIERALKLTTLKPGVDVKCTYCGYILSVRSKLTKVSCSNCGNKTKNTSL